MNAALRNARIQNGAVTASALGEKCSRCSKLQAQQSLWIIWQHNRNTIEAARNHQSDESHQWGNVILLCKTVKRGVYVKVRSNPTSGGHLCRRSACSCVVIWESDTYFCLNCSLGSKCWSRNVKALKRRDHLLLEWFLENLALTVHFCLPAGAKSTGKMRVQRNAQRTVVSASWQLDAVTSFYARCFSCEQISAIVKSHDT